MPKRVKVAGGFLALLAVAAVVRTATVGEPSPRDPRSYGLPSPAQHSPEAVAEPSPRSTPAAVGRRRPSAETVTFSAQARSAQVAITEPIARRRLHLTGDVRFSAGLVDVSDRTGARFDAVTLEAVSDDLRFAGAIAIVRGALTIARRDVRLGSNGLAVAHIEVEGPARIRGRGLVVHEGGERIELRSPVRVSHFIGTTTWSFSPSDARWVDGPAAVRATDSPAVSWDGDGSVETAGRVYTDRFLGVSGALDVQIARAAGAVTVLGNGEATQIFRDGRCAWDTRARIQLHSRSQVTRRAGRTTEIDWEPQNRGRTAMCLTAIRGRTPAGAWVRVALDPLPEMVGGRDRSRGGRSIGVDDQRRCFFVCSPVPLSSFIRPGDGDRRSLTVAVPPDTGPGTYPVTLELRGNFAPVQVTVMIRVR